MALLNRIVVTLLFFLIVCIPFSCDTGGGRTPAVGSRAPDFALMDLSGKSLRLADMRGKVVLLNFWATFCYPCRDEAPSLARLNAAMEGKNFVMIAVALDKEGKEAVESFFRKSGNRLPAFPDPSGKVARLYGTALVPETFIIDKQGVVRKVVHGPAEWDSREMIGFIGNLIKQ